jgi:hypothetical protein
MHSNKQTNKPNERDVTTQITTKCIYTAAKNSELTNADDSRLRQITRLEPSKPELDQAKLERFETRLHYAGSEVLTAGTIMKTAIVRNVTSSRSFGGSIYVNLHGTYLVSYVFLFYCLQYVFSETSLKFRRTTRRHILQRISPQIK